MGKSKEYGSPREYEQKLDRVMNRLGAEEYNHNFDRHGCWVTFKYKGQLYRFEHSVANARENGINLTYGSDAFAQLVLTLEDLARAVERKIYDLQVWVKGMQYLPPAPVIPRCFKYFGFDHIPEPMELKPVLVQLTKKLHPDHGGHPEDWLDFTTAKEEAMDYFRGIGMVEGVQG